MGEPGVFDGGDRRLEREVEPRATEAASNGGLPDARDAGFAVEKVRRVDAGERTAPSG